MDTPSDDTILAAYRGWLRIVAAGMTAPDLVDDLAQEGWVEMWKSLRTYDPARGALPAWLTYRARRRMLDCVTNQAWLGRPRRHVGRGRLADVTEYATPDGVQIWDQLVEPDAFEAVEWAYHRGLLVAAINALPLRQREYVYLRFYRGLGHRELVAAFGYDPTGGMWSHPVHGARARLRTELEALRR